MKGVGAGVNDKYAWKGGNDLLGLQLEVCVKGAGAGGNDKYA